MRFPQIKIGQQFEYQGKRYTKTGPLTASEEGTGASAMIRRSAEVVLVDGAAPGMMKKQVKQIYSREEVIEFFRAYVSRLSRESKQIADENGTLQLERLLMVIEDQQVLFQSEL